MSLDSTLIIGGTWVWCFVMLYDATSPHKHSLTSFLFNGIQHFEVVCSAIFWNFSFRTRFLSTSKARAYLNVKGFATW